MTGAAHPADATPVLVGIGTAQQREADFRDAREPMDLMLDAVRAAGIDCTAPAALPGVQHIAVPQGRWSYANPAGEIARAISAAGASTVLATVGVLQQSLLAEACDRIARGEIHTALVAGADAGYRLLRARIAEQTAPERNQPDSPDFTLKPAEELRHPVELRAGLRMPVGLYAIMESAWRARAGMTLAAHRAHLGGLYARFSEIAAQNPDGWPHQKLDAAAIAAESAHNPMQAFPYNRAHCSNWNVDQAAALLLCSAARATALGIPRDRWIFPWSSAESNAMVAVSARADISRCPGAEIAGNAALAAAGLTAGAVDLIELYSCFPIAVTTYADAIAIPAGRDLTVTGGMSFAGGPYNNTLFQASCRAAHLLREGKGRTALLSCVSGLLTKQAFAIWGIDPPAAGFSRHDVTKQVAAEASPHPVIAGYEGAVRILGCTILAGRGKELRAVALVETAAAERTLATSDDAALIARMQQEEFVGRMVRMDATRLLA